MPLPATSDAIKILFFPFLINALNSYLTIILLLVSLLLHILCLCKFSKGENSSSLQELFGSFASVSLLALLTPSALCSLSGTFASIVPLCLIAFAILNVLPTSYMYKIEGYFCTYKDNLPRNGKTPCSVKFRPVPGFLYSNNQFLDSNNQFLVPPTQIYSKPWAGNAGN